MVIGSSHRHGGASQVIPLNREPTNLASTGDDRSWRQKTTRNSPRGRWPEPPCDRSRECSKEYSNDRPRARSGESPRNRFRENSHEASVGGQRPSAETQMDGKMSPTTPSSQHVSQPALLGNPGLSVAAVVTGANKRRQVGAGKRETLPPLGVLTRHTIRGPRGGKGGEKDDISAKKRGGGRLTSPLGSPAATSRRKPGSPGHGHLSPMARLRTGGIAVQAVTTFSNLPGRASGGGDSFGGSGGAGGGGTGPALGSAQEEALVAERKEARNRHPGPTLEGIGERGPASSAMLALKAHKVGPSLVSPHICIGAREDAKNLEALKELGVTHILNCAKQLPSSHPREFVHARLELADTSEQELAPFQKAGVSFLRQVEGCGGRALVHCIAGCSRSVSIVLLHLMEGHRIRLKLAYEHVRSYRMVAQPNEGFRFQLATTEVKIFGSSSVSRDADSTWNFYRWNEVKQGVPYHATHPPQSCCGCIMA
ncbi:unnamed protein product [Ectocarpus fasciculatus]